MKASLRRLNSCQMDNSAENLGTEDNNFQRHNFPAGTIQPLRAFTPKDLMTSSQVMTSPPSQQRFVLSPHFNATRPKLGRLRLQDERAETARYQKSAAKATQHGENHRKISGQTDFFNAPPCDASQSKTPEKPMGGYFKADSMPESDELNMECIINSNEGNDVINRLTPYNPSSYVTQSNNVARRLEMKSRDSSLESAGSSHYSEPPSLELTGTHSSEDEQSFLPAMDDELNVSLESERCPSVNSSRSTRSSLSTARQSSGSRGLRAIEIDLDREDADRVRKAMQSPIETRNLGQMRQLTRSTPDLSPSKAHEGTVKRGRSVEKKKKPAPPLAAPFTTKRLRPIRRAFNTTIVHILSDGRVVVEIFKMRSNEQRVIKVMYVSSDGQEIIYFQPNGSKGCPVDPNDPPSPCNYKVKKFLYNSLPAEYNKLYNLAANFVTMYRSKTPKFTLYSTVAKVILMEDKKHFVFDRYDGANVTGTFSPLGLGETEVTSANVSETVASNLISEETKQLLHDAEMGLKKTLLLEESDDKMGQLLGHDMFPVTRGREMFIQCGCRRPWKNNIPYSMNELSEPLPATTFAEEKHQPAQLANTHPHRSARSHSQPPPMRVPSKPIHLENPVVRLAILPGVGRAKRLMNDTVIAEFEDGDLVEAFGPIKTVRYRDRIGRWTEYGENTAPPLVVKQKIEKLHLFAEKLVQET